MIILIHTDPALLIPIIKGKGPGLLHQPPAGFLLILQSPILLLPEKLLIPLLILNRFGNLLGLKPITHELILFQLHFGEIVLQPVLADGLALWFVVAAEDALGDDVDRHFVDLLVGFE